PVYNPETYREKALRKFKQQPFVPIGALATTAALVIAMSKMRKGESKSLNTWLRVRVLAQGLTVGAIVLGSWTLGTGRAAQTHVQESAAAALEKVEAESAGFKARLREAEESHRVE
ncbi:hypoxia induced protein conserved region-domain-containing protein, partial [Amylostereum chailletii]